MLCQAPFEIQSSFLRSRDTRSQRSYSRREGCQSPAILSTPLTIFITSCSSRVKLADNGSSSPLYAGDPRPTAWVLPPPRFFYCFFSVIGIP
ncbi:hypothetical protein DsansV1_C18g0149691 [Dioscorea sansibarensis]